MTRICSGNLFVFKCCCKFFQRKLGINGNHLKSIATIYFPTFTAAFLQLASCEVRKLFAVAHCLFTCFLFTLNFSRNQSELPEMFWLKEIVEINPNKHAWRINYTTGDFQIGANWKEAKTFFHFSIFGYANAEPNLLFMLI